MPYLILGLVVFFATHSLQVAWGLRRSLISRMGDPPYKAVYSIVSLAGIALASIGFAQYRADGLIQVWDPPAWTAHLALLLNWFAVIFFFAAYLPCHIRRVLKHPMLVGIKTWAMMHLISNGDLGGMILFGSFLIWAVIVRISIKHRPAVDKPVAASVSYDIVALVVGSAVYAIIVFWLHPRIFNIPVWPG